MIGQCGKACNHYDLVFQYSYVMVRLQGKRVNLCRLHEVAFFQQCIQTHSSLAQVTSGEARLCTRHVRFSFYVLYRNFFFCILFVARSNYSFHCVCMWLAVWNLLRKKWHLFPGKTVFIANPNAIEA